MSFVLKKYHEGMSVGDQGVYANWIGGPQVIVVLGKMRFCFYAHLFRTKKQPYYAFEATFERDWSLGKAHGISRSWGHNGCGGVH